MEHALTFTANMTTSTDTITTVICTLLSETGNGQINEDFKMSFLCFKHT